MAIVRTATALTWVLVIVMLVTNCCGGGHAGHAHQWHRVFTPSLDTDTGETAPANVNHGGGIVLVVRRLLLSSRLKGFGKPRKQSQGSSKIGSFEVSAG
jgi:hypothetical protein